MFTHGVVVAPSARPRRRALLAPHLHRTGSEVIEAHGQGTLIPTSASRDDSHDGTLFAMILDEIEAAMGDGPFGPPRFVSFGPAHLRLALVFPARLTGMPFATFPRVLGHVRGDHPHEVVSPRSGSAYGRWQHPTQTGYKEIAVSDTPQGPGWWQASDGKYYPPEQAPGYTPAAASAGPMGAPAVAGPPGTVDIGAAFSWAVEKFQANLTPLLILGAVCAGVPWIMFLVGTFLNGFIVATLFWLLGIVASLVLSMLVVQAALEIADTGQLNQATMFQLRTSIGGYVGAGMMFTVAWLFGCLLLCVGAIFAWLIFGLWAFANVDEGRGGMDALNRSKELTMGPGLGTTFVPMLVFVLFNGGTMFLSRGFGIGGIIGVVFVPFGSLIGVYIWRALRGTPLPAVTVG